ncbi:Cytochrome oxidase assembly domain containing protein [Rhypophila decipiens]
MATHNSSDAPVPAGITAQDANVAPAVTAGTGRDPVPVEDLVSGQTTSSQFSSYNPEDPLGYGRHKRENVSKKQMKIDHPEGNKAKLKKYYTRQNKLIDQFLGAEDEEQKQIEDDIRFKPRIKFAVRASFIVNFCLFIIQMYAAISTGSLSLFATAADAFMDLVSSFVMLVTSILANRPSVYKYPVGRKRIETIGIILFCALMTTVAIQLIIESVRSIAGGGHNEASELHIIPIVFVCIAIFAKGSLMLYCFHYRRFPSVHVFFIDHRNDIAVNIFGLVMSIVGDKFVWYLDPIGAILIALLILFSWASNAFEQVWLLVGKAAPKNYISKLVYMTMTHDDRIQKIDTCRAYHAGQHYYVEIDIVMDEDLPLKVTHDVGQTLQRKLEGLADVERAFVHVDYDHDHDPHEEHKPLYKKKGPRTEKPKKSIRDILMRRKPEIEKAAAAVEWRPPQQELHPPFPSAKIQNLEIWTRLLRLAIEGTNTLPWGPFNLGCAELLHNYLEGLLFAANVFSKKLRRLHPRFVLKRRMATAATTVPTTPKATSETETKSSSKSSFPETDDKAVGYWLLGSAVSVFGIVVWGGLTRLTESGLSITEWKPVTGSLPPMSDADWQSEFDKYRASPEFQMINSHMNLSEFKKIYFMEWSHRLWGRFIGLSFVLPTVYFIARRRVRLRTAGTLVGISALIGFQGFIGWWMVKSGLKDDLFAPGSHPRVSQYRLAAHLATAFVCYSWMLLAGLKVLRTHKALRDPEGAAKAIAALSSPKLQVLRRSVLGLTALIFTTVLSGALVAGLDAGLIYNEFPKMGNGYMPPQSELWDKFYCRKEDGSDLWWRNMLENPSLVQLDHRILAMTTFTAVLSLFAYSRTGRMKAVIPKDVQKGVLGLVHLVSLQLTLGLTTLLYMVPVPLAAAHQAGALALLTGVLVLGQRLRIPRSTLLLIQKRLKTKV